MSGFDLGGAVNSAADWVCTAPIMRGIVSNQLFTALLIVALVAVVAMSVYGRELRAGGVRRGCRAMLYTLLAVSAVVVVHHIAVERIAQDTVSKRGVRSVFAGVELSRQIGGDAIVPVFPMGTERPHVDGGRVDNVSVPENDEILGPDADERMLESFGITDVIVPSAS